MNYRSNGAKVTKYEGVPGSGRNHNNGAISLMCRSNEEGAREEGLEEREQSVYGNDKENGAKRDGKGEGGQRVLQDCE